MLQANHDDILRLLRVAPGDSAALCQQLGISQPTLSRRLAELGDAVMRVGKARASRYFARRTVAGQDELPLFRVNASGLLQEWGALLPVYPGYIVRYADGRPDVHSEGLPWWMQDMRPQGFLGRAWGRQRAPLLGLPQDILRWQDDDVVQALACGEHDVVGNILIGHRARERWLAHQSTLIGEDERAVHYPRLAQQAMQGEVAASSAGGEQPKFATQIAQPNANVRAVLVKFSADDNNTNSARWRDLLLAEHIALSVLNHYDIPASHSQLIDIGQQRFLELTRFDRVGATGRRGVVSLAGLDAEFIGHAELTWPPLCTQLCKLAMISEYSADLAARLYAFGCLIGNSDMHLGNLSFLHEGQTPLTLAPAYDMLPMAFAPDRSGASKNALPPFILPAQPAPAIWHEMLPIAREYWQQVASDTRCSTEFAAIAQAQQAWLDRIEQQILRLS